jgi:plastocyanin
MPRWYRVILVGFIAMMVLSACSRKEVEPVSFSIDMSEYAFTPDTIEVKVGQQVTLEMSNDGVLAHELMIGNQVKMVDNRPSGYEQDMFEAAGLEPSVVGGEMEEGDHGHHEGFMLILPKTGDKASMTFTVTKKMVGEWEMGCFEQEGVHYTAGMKGKFVVVP